MNVRELINELERAAEDYGDEVEVRLAHQPSWPFEYGIGEVVVVDLNEPDPEDTENMTTEERAEYYESREEAGEGEEMVVYISESGQLGYLPGVVSGALGWR